MFLSAFKSLVPHAVKRKLRKFVWMRLNPSWQMHSGVTIRVLNYNDWMIYNDIFVEGEYDRAIDDLLRGTVDLARPASVLDLGGNVGFFTLRVVDTFLRNSRTNFRVAMVEGSPSTFAELRERISVNAHLIGDRVTLNHGLVGERSGSAEIAEGESHGENTIFSGGAGKTEVPFINLDGIVGDWERIDLLKCDIEGAEELFLRNYVDLLRKTDRAVFEFHHDKSDIPNCRRILADAGLDVAITIREFGHCSVEFFRRASA